MAATQERLDSYMSPVSGPLRPPRRFSSLRNTSKVASVPTLATQVMLRPKRVPPPRPPPPRPTPPQLTITVDTCSYGSYCSSDSTISRTPSKPQRVPPNIYYHNIRLNYKPKRRFVHLKARHVDVLDTYDRPKPPLPVVNGRLQSRRIRGLNTETQNRVQLKNDLNTERNRCVARNVLPLKEITTNAIYNKGVIPTPPPRRRRLASVNRSQTIDQRLEWRPFSWKTRRCRSMTELGCRQRADTPTKPPNRQNIGPKLTVDSKGRPAVRPSRPPLPTGSILFSKRFHSDNYHIYPSIKGVANSKPSSVFADRPLPPPPVPPRPKGADLSRMQCHQKAVRDVCVSTSDNGLAVEMCEKQTQLDDSNDSIREALNAMVAENRNGLDVDLDFDKTPTNPLTPTTPTFISYIQPLNGVDKGLDNSFDKCGERDLQCPDSPTVTSSANWFDAIPAPDMGPGAQAYKDWDEETINDDISSITSNYMSLTTEVTADDSREQTPVPQPPPDPPLPRSDCPPIDFMTQDCTAQKSGQLEYLI